LVKDRELVRELEQQPFVLANQFAFQ
jgi:hypothetical protein